MNRGDEYGLGVLALLGLVVYLFLIVRNAV